MERIEIRQKEKANEESTGMENEENKEGKEKKERSGYSLDGLAAFLARMPYKDKKRLKKRKYCLSACFLDLCLSLQNTKRTNKTRFKAKLDDILYQCIQMYHFSIKVPILPMY